MLASYTPRILVVDDLPDNTDLLQALLEPEGYEIITAHSGTEALAEIAQVSPDLILLDVMMPDLDGLEVTHRLRQNPAYRSLPILLVSAYDSIDPHQSLQQGANGFIRKPFDFVQLLDQVQSLLPTCCQNCT